MTTRIFATLDDFTRPGDGEPVVGRQVANNNFIKSLWRHGTHDEYHFFLANSAHRKLFWERHAATLDALGVRARVRLFDRLDLPEMMRKTDYEVFHLSDHVTSLAALCRLRNRFASTPVTAFIHSLSYPRFMNSYLDLMHGGSADCDALLCSSMAGADVVRKCFERISANTGLAAPPLQYEIVPFGLEADTVPVGSKADARRMLGLADGEVIGLCVGRLSAHDKMDHFPLVQAIEAAGAADHPWRLVLAGATEAGDAYPEMLSVWARAMQVESRVTLIPNPDEAKKWALYRAADFFISATDNPQETFGITLIEAMAHGLPLVVSDYNGYKETATDDVALRVPTTWVRIEPLADLSALLDERTLHRYYSQSLAVDVRVLAANLARFFTDDGLRRNMGDAALRRFKEHYEYRQIISRIEAVWRGLKAECCIAPDPGAPDPLWMDAFEIFSHYPTLFLDDDEVLHVSAFAAQLRRSGAEYPLLPEIGNIIDAEIVRKMLFVLRKPITVREAVESCDCEKWRARFAIQWLIKHGLVE